MLKRLLPVLLLAFIVMILGCPGQPCGPGKIIDCSNNCIDESNADNSVGDGVCDENLNCSEFDYDGGDCRGTNPTTTTTTSITSSSTTTTIDGETTTTTTSGDQSTTTTTPNCDPDPVVDKYSFEIYRYHNATGVCYAINYSIKVENRGCAGEIYFKVTSKQWPEYSDCVVAFMDAGEERFIGPFLFDDMRFCWEDFPHTFTVETRNVQPSDFPECKKPPLSSIKLPENDSYHIIGESITFEGEARISYDGELTGNSLVWTSSLDGQIGTGNSFTRNDLSPGEHTIILTATDSLGDEGTDDVSIKITNPAIDIYSMMVDIPGGTFEMGCADDSDDCYDDEYPQHTVTLTGFKMSKYEVTQGQWEAVMGSKNPSRHDECGLDCPVENVEWNEVQDFINKLNDIFGLNYRLPTEAEWEYAARAGTDTTWYCGNNESCLDSIAWYDDNSSDTTHPVGQKKAPNVWGLYDMSGNVWEWVQDFYDKDYYEVSPEHNPSGPISGGTFDSRVTRGGSFSDDAWDCSSYRRDSSTQSWNWDDIGFRLVLSE